MSETPAPPIAADVDLKDFPFTPIFRARLFGSAFHARASDSEWRAGVTLWLKSWDQSPAGSLPADDIDLCRLAELGRDVKTWNKIKAVALHGWVRHSDGRLYHKVVTEGIAHAWQQKLDQRSRTNAARLAKMKKRLSQTKNEAEHARIEAAIATLSQEMATQTKGRATSSVTETAASVTETATGSKGEGEGEGEGDSILPLPTATPSAAAEEPPAAGIPPEGGGVPKLGPVQEIQRVVSGACETWFDQPRPPGADDAEVIGGWIEAGATAADVDRVCRVQIQRMADRGLGLPVSLRIIDRDVRAAIATHRRPAPPEPTTGKISPATRAVWRKRLEGYARTRGHRGGGMWGDWGDKPGEMGCEAPADLIAEILPDLATSLGAVA